MAVAGGRACRLHGRGGKKVVWGLAGGVLERNGRGWAFAERMRWASVRFWRITVCLRVRRGWRVAGCGDLASGHARAGGRRGGAANEASS